MVFTFLEMNNEEKRKSFTRMNVLELSERVLQCRISNSSPLGLVSQFLLKLEVWDMRIKEWAPKRIIILSTYCKTKISRLGAYETSFLFIPFIVMLLCKPHN